MIKWAGSCDRVVKARNICKIRNKIEFMCKTLRDKPYYFF